ncbi:saccharopine dehydrogenase NADP-binding domain-containing protein [Lentilitoribacter sp. Alg239-R112]|uniref:saccharopine dehydrogenase family protein n=1 Tax=Lentilitoribacter sp. Alg239-R112 TaxID=2305987 RepID=UPI0013A68FC5|nr:saccharopine dehydrogenase NADP-binding domain-containing protein [Lentilitoribacter sp. Alg239-R112]
MDSKPKILIIGGTGIFGTRLVQHLAVSLKADVCLFITSRSEAKAQKVADSIQASIDIKGVGFDRKTNLKAMFADIQPDITVDCSGPFQDADYETALAALASGSHFIDLADAKTYIEHFTSNLNEIARENNLTAITGASTTPALSANVVQTITNDWQQIDKIELAITPGGKSKVGPSVIKALLSYAGREIPIWKNGKLDSVFGLINSKIIDVPNLGKRRIVPVETYDALYLGVRHNVISNVTFYTGLESSLEQWGTICLGYLAKWGMIKNPLQLTPLLIKARSLTRPFTSDRGGMVIFISGSDAQGQDVTTRWSLLATHDDGTFVPILPMAAAIKKLMNAKIETGAMIADKALALHEIEAEMQHHHITTEMKVI